MRLTIPRRPYTIPVRLLTSFCCIDAGEGEHISTGGDSFRSAEFRHYDTRALHRVVDHGVVASVDLDGVGIADYEFGKFILVVEVEHTGLHAVNALAADGVEFRPHFAEQRRLDVLHCTCQATAHHNQGVGECHGCGKSVAGNFAERFECPDCSLSVALFLTLGNEKYVVWLQTVVSIAAEFAIDSLD